VLRTCEFFDIARGPSTSLLRRLNCVREETRVSSRLLSLSLSLYLSLSLADAEADASRMWNDVECVSATVCKLMAIVPRKRRARNTNRRRRWPQLAKLHAKPSPRLHGTQIRGCYCVTLSRRTSEFARKISINANMPERQQLAGTTDLSLLQRLSCQYPSRSVNYI